MATRKQRAVLAVIGDMVGSRQIPATHRPRAQKRFQQLIEKLNQEFRESLRSRFIITLGDEFQGLIEDPGIVPDLIWMIETSFTDRTLRLGFGYGPIDTEIPEYAINVDGPALHAARAAIEEARSKKKLGGVFRGMGDAEEPLNGFARLLWFHRLRRTQQQMKVMSYLREGLSQVEIAAKLHRKPQAISDHVKAAGWEAYREAEAGFRKTLTLFGER
jgi:plasmid stabilization system protein ParE